MDLVNGKKILEVKVVVSGRSGPQAPNWSGLDPLEGMVTDEVAYRDPSSLYFS